MKRVPIGCVVAALAAVLCCVSSAPAQWSIVDSPNPSSWNSAPWTTGAPPTAGETGLLKGGGTVTIDAGSTATTPGGLLIGWNGTFNMAMTGGTLTVGSAMGDGQGTFGLTVGESVGYGTFTQSGGTVTSPIVNLARLTNSLSGIYSLNGGTLETGLIRRGSGSGTATLNLGGGTLRATQSNGGWIAPGIVVNVQAGGALIDTQNYDVTILSPLLNGGGGLTMFGSTAPTTGVLRLGAAGTYTGPTNVNAGYLVTNVNDALPAATVLNLNGVSGAVSRLDLMNTTQKIAGLTSAAGATGTIDIYSGGGSTGLLETDVAAGNTYIYHGAVGNSLAGGNRAFQFVKSGAGTQVLSGPVLHTGGTTVNAGTLQVGNNNALNNVGASSFNVAAGATLAFHRNHVPTDFTNQSIGGAGDVVFRGQKDGYFRFVNSYSGTLSYTGKTVVNLDTGGAEWYMGYLFLERDNVLPHATVVDLQSGKIDLRNQTGSGLTIAGLQGGAATSITATAAGVQKFNVNVADGSTYTYAGSIQGAVALTKSGPGTQVLTGSNTYTGGTTVNAGTLQVGNNNALNNVGASSFNVGVGATLLFNRNIDNTRFTNQSISGAGDVVFRGQQNGYFTFRGTEYSGALTYTGKTVVDLGDSAGNAWYQGTLWLEKDNLLPNSTVLELQSGKIYTRNQTGGGLTIAGLEGNAATFITTDQAPVQKWTVNVAAGNTYTYAGTIGADDTGVGNNNIALTKLGPGTQVLTGSNTYTGGTTIAGGTLAIGGSGSLASAVNLSATGAVLDISGLAADSTSIGSLAGVAGSSVVLGAKRLIAGANSATTVFAGDISGSGGQTKTGTGTFTLSGANTYTGGTLVDMGFLQLDADNALGGGVLSFGGATARASLNMNGRNQTVRGLVAPNAAQYRGDVYNNDGNPTSTLTIDTPAGETYAYANQIGADSGWFNVAVVKRGPGTQVFTGNNNYTGGTTVAGGTLQFGSNSPSGARTPGSVALQNDANLVLSHNYDYAGLSLPNTMGDGNLVLLGQGSGYYSIRPGTTQFSYAGNTTLQLDSQSGGTWQGALFIEPGSVGLPSTTVLNIVSGKLDLRQNQTLAGLTGSGGFVTTDGGVTPTLILDFASTAGPFTYDGVIGRPPGTGEWENTPHVALEKRGTGTQILTGHHNYTGATTVAGGTLAVTGSLPATSTVAVHSGGTLAGTGTIGGPMSILGGGILAPGMSEDADTLHLGGGLSFEQDAFFDIDIEAVDVADLVQMDGGPLDPNGATIRVNLGFDPELGSSWTILQGEGNLESNFNPTVDLLGGAEYLDGWKWFEVGYGNSVVLTLVPEPGTWLLLLVALGCGLLVRRR